MVARGVAASDFVARGDTASHMVARGVASSDFVARGVAASLLYFAPSGLRDVTLKGGDIIPWVDSAHRESRIKALKGRNINARRYRPSLKMKMLVVNMVAGLSLCFLIAGQVIALANGPNV